MLYPTPSKMSDVHTQHKATHPSQNNSTQLFAFFTCWSIPLSPDVILSHIAWGLNYYISRAVSYPASCPKRCPSHLHHQHIRETCQALDYGISEVAPCLLSDDQKMDKDKDKDKDKDTMRAGRKA